MKTILLAGALLLHLAAALMALVSPAKSSVPRGGLTSGNAAQLEGEGTPSPFPKRTGIEDAFKAAAKGAGLADIERAFTKGQIDAAKIIENEPALFSPDVIREEEFHKKNPKAKHAFHQHQEVLVRMWGHFDFLVYSSVRTQAEQDRLVKEGKSKAPDSFHLEHHCPGYPVYRCSMAVDVVPIEKGKARWQDKEQMAYFNGAFIVFHSWLKKEFGWDPAWVVRSGMDFAMTCKTYDWPGSWDPYHLEIRRDRKWNCKTREFQE